MEALTRFFSSWPGRIVAGALAGLLLLGTVMAARTPWNATADAEVRRAVLQQAQLDCYSAARRQSAEGGDREKLAEFMTHCQTIGVRSIRVRGRFSRPVARVVLQAPTPQYPAGLRVRYYRLERRLMSWSARPASETSYNLALF